jgi:tRNA dimethylallyltransferase
LIAIAGATASGKTALALNLARYFPVEIVNADSRAFYRGMDIGTAKPSVAERESVPHHLVDVFEPDQPMTLSVFQRMALAIIAAIHERGHLPLLVGGTPQYVNAVVEGWGIPQVPPNPTLRLHLEREAEREGVAALHDRLRQVDPAAAAKTGLNLRRIVRALEVYLETGTPISQLQTRGEVPFAPLEIELWWPREVLYQRIDDRVDRQVADGLVDEVRGLLEAGYDPSLPSFSSIGYRQLVPAIMGEVTLEDAIARIKLDTHRLVRHQQTWARRNPRSIRIDMTLPDAGARVIELVAHHTGLLPGTR